MTLNERPRREQNAARIRLGLLDAFTTQLRRRSFDDVRVKELCATVSISEPTFFNHFGSKGGLLEYFISVWSIGLQCAFAQQSTPTGLARIELLFVHAGRAIKGNPGVMQEIIAHQIRVRRLPVPHPLSASECLIRFPKQPDAVSFTPHTVSHTIEGCLQMARANQEIALDTDLDTALMLLMAVFFGVPAAEPHAAKTPGAYLVALRAVLATLAVKRQQR